MLMAGHFSVWAVCAGAAAMEERERDNMRLRAVMPFVTARKVSGCEVLLQECGCDNKCSSNACGVHGAHICCSSADCTHWQAPFE
jgi:hypothetical protein